jgi:hypothetical protein
LKISVVVRCILKNFFYFRKFVFWKIKKSE